MNGQGPSPRRYAQRRPGAPFAARRAIAVVLVLSALALGASRIASRDGVPSPASTAADSQSDSSGRRVLRVCADPNNLPFSNAKGEGLENRLAELIAEELDADLEYTWWAQRRGFIRSTLRAGLCDLIPGVPSSYELVLATTPYYRSTYVFVYRADAGFELRSFDDAILRRLRIGVHVIGDDYANAPPAHALGARGIVKNVSGYSIYGDYAKPNPPARLVEAVAEGAIDVAIIWGPFAGYFAPRQTVPLEIMPVSPQIDVPFLPMVYDIAMGVRREDTELLREVNAALSKRRQAVDTILASYGVPLVEMRRP